ncbi:MAG: hypothetical protein GY702_00960, partial [Desulfobulbaceae bacterium]|nr:hypothetical protein [Desulfobulbaceae bacterium]
GANSRGVVDAIISRGANPRFFPDSYHNLKGSNNKKFLQYERQGTGRGINLGWTSDARAKTAKKAAHWMFVPKDQSKRVGQRGQPPIRQKPIRYGEIVAIAWWPPTHPSWDEWSKSTALHVPKFLTYSRRNVGINLKWSEKGASYEWIILGGKPGDQVKKGKDWVVIYNLTHKQPLVYETRTIGGHIGWPDSNPLGGSVREKWPQISQEVWDRLKMPGVR